MQTIEAIVSHSLHTLIPIVCYHALTYSQNSLSAINETAFNVFVQWKTHNHSFKKKQT